MSALTIYAGNPDGAAVDEAKSLGMGVMVASSDKPRTSKAWRSMPCALDNGAFRCWQRGYPFQPRAFRAQLESCYRNGIDLDFIVCPDIVAGGIRSLAYSLSWIQGDLATAPRLALAVQDGMSASDLAPVWEHENVSHLFVGGTIDWKWRTAESWVLLAHQNGRRCHIGRCGTLEGLRRAAEIGADSVDSTSFARNGSFDIVREFQQTKQPGLWS